MSKPLQLIARLTLLALTGMSLLVSAQSDLNDFNGHWVASRGVAFAPWTFDFKVEGGKLTGVAGQNSADAASGYSTNGVGPFDVHDGRAEGNAISFTLKTADGGRVITFQGVRNGNEIAFARSVALLSGDPGRDGILGVSGATQFVATRDSAAGRG
jgi:hypothetical protein